MAHLDGTKRPPSLPGSRSLARMTDAMTIEDQGRRALEAYEGLESLAEDIEDEWTYVTDLGAAWRARIEELIAERGADSVGPPQDAAVGQAIDEIGRITDPHRAIDWLSTFPQVVLIALGEQS
jgi:hypothetical protein